jgi:acetyl-CoA C-acetyltransferase
MRNAVLVSAARTPVGKMGGVYKNLQRMDLAVPTIQEAIKRAGISSEEVEEVFYGNMIEFLNPGRYAWLSAGMNIDTACLTINRACATGLTGLGMAGIMIKGGHGDVYLCGGTEMDSRKFFTLHVEKPYSGGGLKIDSKLSSPVNPYGNPSMLQTAENVAEKWGITREECDAFGYRSQMLAAKGYEEGIHQESIIPITVPQKKGDPLVVTQDEPFRPDTTLEALAKLKPVQGGVITGGNASPLNDGSAAAVMMEEEKARALGLKPMMRFVDYATVGVDPRYMGIGPVPSTQKLLKRNGMTVADVDFFELNEAFSSQSIACIRELNLDIDKVNMYGGAIALGHPYSATGINLAAKAAAIFKHKGGERCVITFCVGGGQGVACLFENCD